MSQDQQEPPAESVIDPVRRRVVEWHDPAISRPLFATLSGLEYLRRVAAGTLPPPPMGRLMNLRLVDVDRGRVVFEAAIEEYHYNPMGIVHGGLAATLLDSAMGCSIHSSLEAGDRYTTVELSVHYLKALTREAGTVRGEGGIVSIGRTTALTEGRVVGGDGTLYAHATSLYLLKRA